MIPVKFPQHTTVLAEDQHEYLPLPAYVDENETISCWHLGWRERLAILFTGRLWVRQLNFGKPLQPQCFMSESPFVNSEGD